MNMTRRTLVKAGVLAVASLALPARFMAVALANTVRINPADYELTMNDYVLVQGDQHKVEMGQVNCDITAWFTAPGGAVLFRAKSESSYITGLQVETSSSATKIYRYSNGAKTLVRSGRALAPGEHFTIKIRGTIISLWAGAEQICAEFTDTTDMTKETYRRLYLKQIAGSSTGNLAVKPGPK